MPWKVSRTVDERMRFIVRLELGERMSDLCREFGISRKTGYKFWNRFQEFGGEGLCDTGKAPISVPHKTGAEVERLVLDFRNKHPTWGPRKIKHCLEQDKPGISIPAASTIGMILLRHGLSVKRKPRRAAYSTTCSIGQSDAPNEVWCIDFKGHFRLGNKCYCYPLTISDHFSRYALRCEALEGTAMYGAWGACNQAFHEYGLPDAIRSDNGGPFASTGLLGLTKLSVWWLRLGIKLQRIQPGHPEQNGRHERWHLTLKTDAMRPVGRNLLHQQEKFDDFLAEYNERRPHEAIEMKTPSALYRPSLRKLPDELPELDYPLHDKIRTVAHNGCIRFKRHGPEYYMSRALVGEKLGLREIEPNVWTVTFMDLEFAKIDTNQATMTRCDVPPMGGTLG